MGWYGYGIYDGDGTQSCHYDFIKWSGIKVSDDEISNWLVINKTKIPDEYIIPFIKGIPKIIKKMPNVRFWNEDKAIEWQMLAALLRDNNIWHRKIIDKGLVATDYLMGDHVKDFDKPTYRRAALKRFKAKLLN